MEIQDASVLLREQRDLNHRQLALLSHAIKHADAHPTYSLKGHQHAHGTVYETARQDLADLERRNLLASYKVGRTLEYTPAPDLLDRLSDAANRTTGFH